MKKEKGKEIMTVKQVADYLQMDEHTIYKLSRSGRIPSFKIYTVKQISPFTSSAGLNRNDVYQISVNIPPLEIQKQIVEELDKER